MQKRSNSFDFLRLFAAATVVITHAVEHLDKSFLWFSYGEGYWFFHGVPLFFMISGYLIYKSYEKCVALGRPVWHFYANRFLRVAPAVYVYAIIAATLFIVMNVISWRDMASLQFIGWFGSNFALIPVYHPDLFKSFGVGVINGSLWTIPTEIGFYLIVPAIFLLQRKLKFSSMIAVLMVTSVAGMGLKEWLVLVNPESLTTKFFSVSLFPYLLYFTLGVGWTKLWPRVQKSKYLALVCLIVYFCLTFDEFGLKQTLHSEVLWNILWSIPLSYLTIYLGYNGPKIFNTITTKIGDLSYGVYVWHMVVINLVLYLGLNQLSGTTMTMVVVITSLIVAALSWTLVEKPALSFKPYTSIALNTKRKVGVSWKSEKSSPL